MTQDDNYALKRSCLYDRCVPVLEVLVRHGADVNAPGAVIAATKGMALDCLRWLLENGATITGTARQGDREVHWNAFTHAAHFEKNRPGTLALMLQHGISVDDVHPDEGNTLGGTALHNTARQGDTDGVKLLLQHGADVTIKNELGETPLDVARNDEVRALLTDRPCAAPS